jgi:hypothetical protein
MAMGRSCGSILLCLILLSGCSAASLFGQNAQTSDTVLTVLASHEYDLSRDGTSFLLNEARSSDFFMLGELHGDHEIPAFLRTFWPQLWKSGYRHIGAEISPWAAHQLEQTAPGRGPELIGLWTKRQAREAHFVADPGSEVLWGCDMEEIQPQFLIRELASLSPADPSFGRMVQMTKDGYDRKMAPDLLALATSSKGSGDELVNGISLRQNLLASLEIDRNRSSGSTKMIAQNERELLMKEQLLAHLGQLLANESSSKALLRFGRNHLHRGLDARGISTLGNFVVEFAIEHGRKAFNVGAFAAGGKETLLGATFDADERSDELALARRECPLRGNGVRSAAVAAVASCRSPGEALATRD